MTSLQLENMSIMKVNTDWKYLQYFIFMDLKKKAIKLAQKIIKTEENLNKIVKHCPK